MEIRSRLLSKGRFVIHLDFKKKGICHAMWGPHEEAPGLVRRQRDRGTVGKRLYCGFSRKVWRDSVCRLRAGLFK